MHFPWNHILQYTMLNKYVVLTIKIMETEALEELKAGVEKSMDEHRL